MGGDGIGGREGGGDGVSKEKKKWKEGGEEMVLKEVEKGYLFCPSTKLTLRGGGFEKT